jgi:hypothetical protein
VTFNSGKAKYLWKEDRDCAAWEARFLSIMWILETLIFSLSFLAFHGNSFALPSRSFGRLSSDAKMMATTEVNGIMSFGSKIPMKVTLPTRDAELAKTFISNLDSIVESTYEAGKYTKMLDGTYLLQFATLPLPGVDKITPEIEVKFVYNSDEGTIRMNSGNWTLRGTTGVLKDSRFMQTFAIELEGILTITPQTATGPVIAEGFVQYIVQGEKPGIFKRAPSFLLDKTIDFIKESINEFASKDFQIKFLKAFRSYALADLKAKASKQSVR